MKRKELELEALNCKEKRGLLEENSYGTNPQDEANSVTVNADEFPDPTIWLSLRNVCPDDPDATITLYKESKSNILDKTGWLYD